MLPRQTAVGPRQWEEVHISSEQMVKDSRMGCMATRSEENIKLWLDKFRIVLKDLAQQSKTESFIENVATSFYNDDIMVFTPKGAPSSCQRTPRSSTSPLKSTARWAATLNMPGEWQAVQHKDRTEPRRLCGDWHRRHH